jgi:hypothetical protein
MNALVGIRTQDPSIKSAVLYQLSYERDVGFYPVFLTTWLTFFNWSQPGTKLLPVVAGSGLSRREHLEEHTP